ncbi:MAG TPA: gliding motility-associated C-terminal domain-containing protein, partial [Chitinophagales bacterium]|nr:gliding motility-associated C-terminal domain-containing protein [Chitinophagales bacterium]
SLPGIESVVWDPAVPCADDPCFEVTVYPTTTTTYTVTVTDDQGCVATTSITINVEFVPEVFFPTAFSPNGDGTNDFFQGISYNIESYTLRIYNRWGEVMFETNDIAGPGWNGVTDGEPQGMGTYVWQVDAGFINGEKFSETGNFVLVR